MTLPAAAIHSALAPSLQPGAQRARLKKPAGKSHLILVDGAPLAPKAGLRAHGINLITFFAAILTLYGFALIHLREGGAGATSPMAPDAPAALAPIAPGAPGAAMAMGMGMGMGMGMEDPGFEWASGRLSAPDAEEYASFYLGAQEDAQEPVDPFMMAEEPDGELGPAEPDEPEDAQELENFQEPLEPLEPEEPEEVWPE